MKHLLKTALVLIAAGGGLAASGSAFAFPEPYCVRGYSNSVEPITSVDVDGIHNASSATVGGTPADEDFTAITGQFAPGGAYPISVAGNTDGPFTTAIGVYVDWDHNGTFETATEGYFIGTITESDGADGTLASTTIAVPATATLGQTRMRVVKQYTSVATPSLADALACGTSGFGQAEDYTVNLDPNAPIPPTLAMAFAPTNGPVGASSTLSLTLGNTMTAASTLTADLTDSLPAGMVIAALPNAATTCSDGTLTAVAGSGSVTLAAGASIPSGSCTVSVDVTTPATGIFVNTLVAGALQTTGGNGPGASATYQSTSPGVVTYGVGFEAPDYTVANLSGQHGWYGSVANDWKVSTTHPAGGTQHVRGTWTAAGSGTTFMLSPTQQVGTTDYSVASANVAISVSGSGTTWDFAPQDPAAGSVVTRVRFSNVGNKIQVLGDTGGGVLGYLDTGATWTADAYFNVKLVTHRADSSYKVCIDDTQVYTGSGFAGNVANIAIIGTKGAGTQNNLLDVDDLILDNTNNGSCTDVTPLQAPTVAVGFAPDSVAVDSDSTATVTLTNSNASDVTLSTDFTDTLPAGLVASAATTTCGGAASFTAGTLMLAGGATIPANASCTLTGTVQAAASGSYVNTIHAGDLQTDAGNNPEDVSATLTVTGGSGGDDLVCSGAVNHTILADGEGTYINWLTGVFNDGSAPPEGYHFNPYGSTGLSFFWGSNTRNAGVASSSSDGSWLILQVGDVVGSASTFSRSTGAASNWRADADGYLGFSFDCSALSPAPPSGTCYGYAHMTATAPTGHPAAIVDYCYDKSGSTITIQGDVPVDQPPSVAKAFTPDTVSVDSDSTATITLGNTNATVTTLTADLVDTLPAGLLASAATTTCGGTASFTAGTLTLGSGATIPAAGSCTISATVRAAIAGSYVNTILAGDLQTDAGSNTADASATLTVIPVGGSNGIISSGPLNHAVQETVAGTSLNIVTSAFDDSGPVSGDWDFNFWKNTNFAFYTITTYATAYVVDANGNAIVLHDGDVVGPASTFSTGASVTAAPEWAAGVDGVVGVRFNCDGRLTFPVAGAVCYGYIHIATSGPTGFPAMIVDSAFDGDGNPVTVVGPPPGNDPMATVTPASLSITAAANGSGTSPLNIANAAGSDALTYAIEARAAGTRPVLRPHARSLPGSKARATTRVDANAEAKLLEMRSRMPVVLADSGLRGMHRDAAPWTPTGTIQWLLDDGTYENGIGWGDEAQTTESAAVWLNRFTATAALTIDSVSIMWPQNNDGSVVGRQANIVAYYDAAATGNPANAVRLGTDVMVTIASLDAFENYATAFSVPGAGDVYIGFVDDWATDGFSPMLYPAAMDSDSGSQDSSFVSANDAGGPDVSVLGNNDYNDTIGALSGGTLDGNWLIRASGTAGGGGTSCTGPVVSWLTATPSSGSVNGGAGADVTVKATPAAGSLDPGSYTAELCITTNDPARPLISVPVSLTVTAAPFVACSSGDQVFCDGFDGAAAGNPDIVVGTVNLPVDASEDGSTLDLQTGSYGSYDAGRIDDINLYALTAGSQGPAGMYVYWYGDASTLAVGGVVDSLGTDFAVLHSGDTIGPGSTISAASIAMMNWLGGADGYVGIAFENEQTGALNYGYIHLTTTGPEGFPAQVLEYGYNKVGDPITVP